MKRNGVRLESLVPYSTEPQHFRTVKYDAKIVKFIREQREDHPRLGKEKIKPLLDEHCRQEQLKGAGFQTVSESTIGNIIKRNHLFYHYRGTKKLVPCLQKN